MTAPTVNAAWTIPAHATTLQHLTKQSLPIPTPGPQQVVVQLAAASLNYRDLLITTRSPIYPTKTKDGLVPAADGAGTIHSTHSSSSWAGKEGAKVILHPNGWLSGDVTNLSIDGVFGANSTDGTLQTYIICNDERVIPAPKHLSLEESATLQTAGVTAWAAMRGLLDGRLDGTVDEYKGGYGEKRLKGKTVLTMGTGGVSCFAIQIASALGATVIATSSSDAKLELAKSIGATHVINYSKNPEWDQEVLRLTNNKGVDHVYEVAGAKTLMKSINSSRRGALISLIGVLSGSESLPASLVPTLMFSGKVLKGCVGYSRDNTAEFVKFLEEHNVKPAIAKSFEFDQAIEAFELLQEQSEFGKIVVRIQ